MTSKAEYLKRYMEGEDGADEQNKKKKKRSSSNSIKISTYSGLKVVDNSEHEWKKNEEGDDDDLIGGGATIVDASELHSYAAVSSSKGSWTTVEEKCTSAGAQDSDDDPPRRRKATRNDSSDSDAEPPRRPQAPAQTVPTTKSSGTRADSDDDGPPRRRRHDSGDSDEPPRRPKSSPIAPESSNPNDQPKKRTTTASGHAAGLVTAEQFRSHEAKLRQEREAALTGIDDSVSGKVVDTTYRDKRGKKLDMLSEFMRQQAIAEGKAVRLEKAQLDWGKGVVQKESAENAKKELELLAAEPFARTIDDPRMEAMRKQEIREGDPMAEYVAKMQHQREPNAVSLLEHGQLSVTARKPRKPVYKGPAPPPNRFNILPGYRWDGNDRGNQWESKVLKAANSRVSIKADAAAWSMQDM